MEKEAKYILPVKDKVQFTWKKQSKFCVCTFYLEKTKNIFPGKDKVHLPGKDKVHFTGKRQRTFYLEKTKFCLPGKNKVHFTWKILSTCYL